MSLFKPYRIKRHNLIFTRIEADFDEYICDRCGHQGQCGRQFRVICTKTNHEIVERGHTDIYSYVIKSPIHKKGN